MLCCHYELLIFSCNSEQHINEECLLRVDLPSSSHRLALLQHFITLSGVSVISSAPLEIN